jgi:hypothetical protein
MERVHAVRYRLRDTTWDALMERLAGLRYRAAIVGPDGSGKTTLLEALAGRLAALGFATPRIQLHTADRTLPRGLLDSLFAEVGERDIILIDGADLMGRVAWQRFRRRARGAAGLLVTSHRPGLLPTLFECSTSLELLDDIVAELLPEEAASLQDTTRRLFWEHGGNLRGALRALYDLYARR